MCVCVWAYVCARAYKYIYEGMLNFNVCIFFSDYRRFWEYILVGLILAKIVIIYIYMKRVKILICRLFAIFLIVRIIYFVISRYSLMIPDMNFEFIIELKSLLNRS